MRAFRMHSVIGAAAIVLAGSMVAGGCLTAVAAAAAKTSARLASPDTGYVVTGTLEAVAATSATNAWAVGTKGDVSSPLILHWNGTRWSNVPTGAPAGSLMFAVAASSAGNAWALALHPVNASSSTVILHWNGRAWKRVSYSAPAGTNLSSVSVTSPGNAWAVGRTRVSQMIALHWNGSAWRRVPLPKLPAPDGVTLTGVSATSATNAWAVGAFLFPSDLAKTGFTLHWNGKSWSRVASPPAAGCPPLAVAATSPGIAWLIGCPWQDGRPVGVVTARWNGHAWKTVPTPVAKPPSSGVGDAIAAAGDLAWAAGTYGPLGLPMLLRWTGSVWKLTSVPSSKDTIAGVAVISAANAWAVGSTQTYRTTILHWNGSSWH
jgi:hypothetical protein